MVLLEIIFVRHGVSCANAMKYRDRVVSQLYRDPELTAFGIQRSQEKANILQSIVAERFPDNAYSIGASFLMRAQQTAFHMLAHDAQKPIHILPHIGETGIGPSNIPLSVEKQRTILDPAIVRQIGTDERGDLRYGKRANWDSFMKWIRNKGDDLEPFFTPVTRLSALGSEETVYRAVVVSHSNFLKKQFGIKLFNNDVIFVTMNTETKEKMFERITYFDESDISQLSNTEGCLMPTPRHVLRTLLGKIREHAIGIRARKGTRKLRRVNRTSRQQTRRSKHW